MADFDSSVSSSSYVYGSSSVEETEETQEDTTTEDTNAIVTALAEVFPAGLAKEVVIQNLMETYGIDESTALYCYNQALTIVSDKYNVEESEIQTNPYALVSEDDRKKGGMSDLSAYGDYQKMLLDASSNSSSAQGGD